MFFRRLFVVMISVLLAAGLSACSGESSGTSGDESDSGPASGEQFPDIESAEISGDPGGPYSFAVTMSSPYDTPDRYADSMRVRSADGDVFGERPLTHDHAGEQPFTRDISDVQIPDGVTEVLVEGHDQKSGWGGDTVTVAIP